MFHLLFHLFELMVAMLAGAGGGIFLYVKHIAPDYRARWLKAVQLLKQEQINTRELEKVKVKEVRDEWTFKTYTRELTWKRQVVSAVFIQLERPGHQPIILDWTRATRGLPTAHPDFEKEWVEYQDRAGLMLQDLSTDDGLPIEVRKARVLERYKQPRR
jgi:hypothetical protein